MKKTKHSRATSNNAIIWIAVGLSLAAVILVDRLGMPQKWHAAIMWTLVAFAPPTVVRRKKWRLPSFWFLWTVCFGFHLSLMWLVFARLLEQFSVVGMLYVVPIGAIEAFVLLIVFSKRWIHRSLQSKA